jgi:hypothetical protein
MKQYTDKDQTAKLMELGFPKPQYALPIRQEGQALIHALRYCIGELIEFLPLELEPHPDTARRTIVGNEVLYCDEYIDWVELRFNKHKEIIDNLFDACVTLKEEGLI